MHLYCPMEEQGPRTIDLSHSRHPESRTEREAVRWVIPRQSGTREFSVAVNRGIPWPSQLTGERAYWECTVAEGETWPSWQGAWEPTARHDTGVVTESSCLIHSPEVERVGMRETEMEGGEGELTGFGVSFWNLKTWSQWNTFFPQEQIFKSFPNSYTNWDSSIQTWFQGDHSHPNYHIM